MPSLSQLLPDPLKQVLKRLLRIEERRAKKRANAVRDNKGKVSAAQIAQDLDALPIPEGGMVFIHSALSSLGYLDGGAPALVDLLCDRFLPKGVTMAMPAFTLKGNMLDTLTNNEIFHVRNTPTTMGKIPAAFLAKPGVHRSVHPTHSVAALGPAADWLTKEHESCGSTFGPGSPFGKLVEAGGYLLYLGVDLGPSTFVHVIEDMRDDFPINVYTDDSPLSVHVISAAGQTLTMPVSCHRPGLDTRIDKPSGVWNRALLTHYLEHTGKLTRHRIGKGEALLVKAADFQDALADMLAAGLTVYATSGDQQGKSLPGELAAACAAADRVTHAL